MVYRVAGRRGQGLAGLSGPAWYEKWGDLSQFVEEAVQVRLFELTVQDVKQRNRDYSQNEILEAIDKVLADGQQPCASF